MRISPDEVDVPVRSEREQQRHETLLLGDVRERPACVSHDARVRREEQTGEQRQHPLRLGVWRAEAVEVGESPRGRLQRRARVCAPEEPEQRAQPAACNHEVAVLGFVSQ